MKPKEKETIIEEGKLITCEKCGHPFRWKPSFNNTIAPKKCRICYNTELLERSNLATRKWKSKQKPTQYPIKERKSGKQPVNGLKKNSAKTDKKRARKLADDWFSRYIRCKYHYKILPDGTVLCKCIISGIIKQAKNIDNGHCFSRAFLTTRYEEDNCRPQNRSSNRFSGEADHYKFIDNLKEEIGEERFNRIDQLRQSEENDTISFYLEQAEKYRKLTNELVKEFSIKKWW